MNCINLSHPDYKSLKESSKLKEPVLKAKIALWQSNNNTESFPSLEELNQISGIDLTHKNAYENLSENHPKINEGTFNQLITFCRTLNPNFKVEVFETLGVNAIADINNFAIGLRTDSLEELSEEVAHFYIELMGDRGKRAKMIEDIQSTEIYQTVFLIYSKYEAYQKDGKPDIDKIAKEAMAKVVAAFINGQDIEPMLKHRVDSPKRPVKGLFNKFIAFIEKLLNFTRNVPIGDYTVIANKILMGDISDITSEDIFGVDLEYYNVTAIQMSTLLKPISLNKYIYDKRIENADVEGLHTIIIEKSALEDYAGNPTLFAKELKELFDIYAKTGSLEKLKSVIAIVTKDGRDFTWNGIKARPYSEGTLDKDTYQNIANAVNLYKDASQPNIFITFVNEIEKNSLPSSNINFKDITAIDTDLTIANYQTLAQRGYISTEENNLTSQFFSGFNQEKQDEFVTLVGRVGRSNEINFRNLDKRNLDFLNEYVKNKSKAEIIKRLQEVVTIEKAQENFLYIIQAYEDAGNFFDELYRKIDDIFGENSKYTNEEKIIILHDLNRFTKQYIANVSEIRGYSSSPKFKEWANNFSSKAKLLLEEKLEPYTKIYIVDKVLAEFDKVNKEIEKEYDETIETIRQKITDPILLQEYENDRNKIKESLKVGRQEIENMILGKTGDIYSGSGWWASLRSSIDALLLPASMSSDKLIQALEQVIDKAILKSEMDTSEKANDFMFRNRETLNNLADNNIDRLQIGKFITFVGWDTVVEEKPFRVLDENGNPTEDVIWLTDLKVVPSKQFKTKYDTRYMVLDRVKQNEINRLERMVSENYKSIEGFPGLVATPALLEQKREEYKQWKKANFYSVNKDEVENSRQAIIDKYDKLNEELDLPQVIKDSGLGFGAYIIQTRRKQHEVINFIKNQLKTATTSEQIKNLNIELTNAYRELRIATFRENPDSSNKINERLMEQAELMDKELKEHSEKYYDYYYNWTSFYIDLKKKLDTNPVYEKLRLSSLLDSLIDLHTTNTETNHNRIMYDFLKKITSTSFQYDFKDRQAVDDLVYQIKSIVNFKPKQEYYEDKANIVQQLNEIYFEINPNKFYSDEIITNSTQAINNMIVKINRNKPNTFVTKQDANGVTRYFINVKNAKGEFEEKEIGTNNQALDENGVLCKYYFDDHSIGLKNYVVIKKIQNDNILGIDNADIDTLWTEIISKVKNYRNQQGEVLDLPLELQEEVTILNEQIENALQELKEQDDTKVPKQLKQEIRDLIDQLDNLQSKRPNYFYYGEFIKNIENVENFDNELLDKLKNSRADKNEFINVLEEVLNDPYFVTYMSEDIEDLKEQLKNTNSEWNSATSSSEKAALYAKAQQIGFKIWFKSNHFKSKRVEFTGEGLEYVSYYKKSYHWLKYEPKSPDYIDTTLNSVYSERLIKEEFKTDDSLRDPHYNFVPRDNAVFDTTGLDLPEAFGKSFGAFSEDWKEFQNGYHLEREFSPEDGSIKINRVKIPMIDEIKRIHEDTLKMHLEAQDGVAKDKLGYNTARLHKDVSERGILKSAIDDLFERVDREELGISNWNSAAENQVKLNFWQKILRWLGIKSSIDVFTTEVQRAPFLDQSGLPIRKLPIVYTRPYKTTSNVFTGKKSFFYDYNYNMITDDVIISTFSYMGETQRLKGIYEEMAFVELFEEMIDNPSKKSPLIDKTKPNRRREKIKSYIDQKIYRKLENSGLGWEIMRVIKKAKIFKTQSILNIKGNIKNLIAGKFVNMINQTVTLKGELLAHKNQWDITISNVKNIEPTKDILLFKMLNPLEAQVRERYNLKTTAVTGSEWKNNLNNWFFFGVKQGELHIIIQAMYTFLTNKKVIKNGVTMDLYDAISFVDGQLNYDGITNLNGTEFDYRKEMLELTRELKYFRMKTQGQGSDPIAAKGTALGNFFLFMNSYLVPSFYNKYRKNKTVNLASKTANAGYNMEFKNFLMRAIKGEGLNAWDFSTKTEKQAIKSTLKSIAFQFLLAFVIKVLLGWKDYPDDENDGELTKAEKKRKAEALRELNLAQMIILDQSIAISAELESFSLVSLTNKSIFPPPIIGDNFRTITGTNAAKGAIVDFTKLLTHLKEESVHQFEIGEEWKWSGIYKRDMPQYNIKKGDHKLVRDLEKMFDPLYRLKIYTDKEKLAKQIEMIQKFDDADY